MVHPRPRTALVGVLLLALLLPGGCAHKQLRLQSEDDSDKDHNIKVIGDVTEVDNAQDIPVSGVGLVTGLRGTGGRAPNGYRLMVEDYLKKHNVAHVKEVLDSPDTSVVFVAGKIPAGAHKGDKFDVEITLPPQCRTSSLQGGVLYTCLLYNYEWSKTIDPAAVANKLLQGHPLAVASGTVLTGLGDSADNARQRRGVIWSGATVKMPDRPFCLALKGDAQTAAMSQIVAERVNESLQGTARGPNTELAVAKTSQAVYLKVPEQYKHNVPRYLRVVRLIPLRDVTETRGPYQRRLADELLDPKHTYTAALRLEALGARSIPTLKDGLLSDHALVRFCSAEALAYLGDPSCGQVLAQMVENQPSLRGFSLTALASLDETISHVKLRELLSSKSAEVRYGAFRALRALDENEPSIQGELLNDSFWVHRAAPQSTPLVHMSFSRRPEIVLFGEEVALQPPFSFLAGDYTITAGRDDDHCTIRRCTVHHSTQPRQCSLKLYDVLHTLADMGAMYPEAVELLQQARKCETLTCQMAIDALPQRTSEYYLAKEGATDPDFVQDDDEIRNAQADFLSMPNLFERAPRKSRTAALRDEEADLREPPRGEKRTAQRSRGD